VSHPRTGPTAIARAARLKRPQFTGRSMMITAMSLFLVVLLASPLQTYLNRRDSVAQSKQQQAQLQQQVSQLQQQSAQWADPAYVEREARARLQYVRPGDTLYSVINPDGTPRSTARSGGTTAKTGTGQQSSWNSTLWSSVKAADRSK
jgi:cell division protein FtsB